MTKVTAVGSQENGSFSISFFHFTCSLSHPVLERKTSTIWLPSLKSTQHRNHWSMNFTCYFEGERICLHRWNCSLQSPSVGAKGPLHKGKSFPGQQPLPQGTSASQSLYSLKGHLHKGNKVSLEKGLSISVCVHVKERFCFFALPGDIWLYIRSKGGFYIRSIIG